MHSKPVRFRSYVRSTKNRYLYAARQERIRGNGAWRSALGVKEKREICRAEPLAFFDGSSEKGVGTALGVKEKWEICRAEPLAFFDGSSEKAEGTALGVRRSALGSGNAWEPLAFLMVRAKGRGNGAWRSALGSGNGWEPLAPTNYQNGGPNMRVEWSCNPVCATGWISVMKTVQFHFSPRHIAQLRLLGSEVKVDFPRGMQITQSRQRTLASLRRVTKTAAYRNR